MNLTDDKHLLVTFAARGDVWDYRKQHELFSGRSDEMREHDLAMAKFFEQKPSMDHQEPMQRGSYEEAMDMFDLTREDVQDFMVLLMTKDRRVLIESDKPIEPDQVFRALERYEHEPQIDGL